LKKQPKIAFIDIETAPGLGWAWASYETDIIEWKGSWFILCFSVRWLDERKTQTYSLADFPGYERHKENDKALVKKLWSVFDEADIIIAHNGDRFDIKKANARFVFHGLRPPSPYRTIDTLKIARASFRFDSNRLNALGGYLKLGTKKTHTGFDLWKRCMRGELKAWAKLKAYCARDVDLLFKVYHKLRPWAKSLPNLTAMQDKQPHECCPACGSEKVQQRGSQVALLVRKFRYHCQDCGKWFLGKAVKKNKGDKRASRKTS
jgi:hypothetical protein